MLLDKEIIFMRRIHSKPIQRRDVDQASCWWVCTLNPWPQAASAPPGQLPQGKVSSRQEKFCLHIYSRHILHILLYMSSFSSQTCGCSHYLWDRNQTPPGGWSRPSKPTCPMLHTLLCWALAYSCPAASIHWCSGCCCLPRTPSPPVSCSPGPSWIGTVLLPDFVTGTHCDLVWIAFIWSLIIALVPRSFSVLIPQYTVGPCTR